MRYLLLAILFLFTTASAQPMEGPFTVLEISEPYNLSNPHLVLRNNSTADLFYQMADTVYHSTVLLSSGAILAGPQAMTPDSGFTRRLYDAVWTDSGWVAIVYDNDNPGNWNRTIVYRGQDTVLASREIDSGRNYSASQWFGSSVNSSLTLAARDSGQFAAAWNDDWNVWVGFWCGGFSMIGGTYTFPGDPLRQFESMHAARDTLLLCSIGQDSLLALGNTWGDLCICSLLSESYLIPCSEYGTLTYPIAFLPTRGGRYFILSQSDSARLIELGDETVTERLCVVGVPIASSPSRDYGFAWLSKLGEELYLYRIDTLAMEHLPAGQLYVPASTHQVAVAHLDIISTGKIALCWTERPAPSTSANTIKIASLGWNTALEADDPHSILPPSSFTLSSYPNPFNNQTKIDYSLAASGIYDLSVYNLEGRLVATLRSGKAAAGNYSTVWRPAGGSGVYFIRLQSGMTLNTLKTVYLK
jgi:hypothetical protein